MGSTKTSMISKALVAFVLFLAVSGSVFEKNESKAKTVLKAKGFESWDKVCQFNSVEAWIEFKDEVEETSGLPEKEVDTLERCVSKCYWADVAEGVYEDHRETQEEEQTPFVPACPQCFDKLPRSGSWRFSQDC